MSAPIVVSGVIYRDEAGRILSVRKRGTDRFMLVGGKPLPGESALEAARRESHEEIGFRPGDDDLIELGTWRTAAANEPGREVEGTLFLAATALPVTPAPHAEIAELKWLDPTDCGGVRLAHLLREAALPSLAAYDRPRGPQLPPALRPDQAIALVSPSTSGPALHAGIHAQARARLSALFGADLVEYPSTRTQGAAPAQRARDLEAAFSDPHVGAIMATLGGFDEDTVIALLDRDLCAAHPTAFFGYSDNTHLLNALWRKGVAGYYGGSTNVHIGAGPGPDPEHLHALRCALTRTGVIRYTDPAWTQDHGLFWEGDVCLTERGEELVPDPTEWIWDGDSAGWVDAPTWGGCLETFDDIRRAGLLPTPDEVAGCILFLEASERLTPPDRLAAIVERLGRDGLLDDLAGVIIARPPTSTFGVEPTLTERRLMREAVYVEMGAMLRRYTQAPLVCGVHAGHTRPQQVIPYGGRVRLNTASRRLEAWLH